MSQVIEEIQNIGERRANPATRLDGVVIGLLTGFNGSGLPLVVFAANCQVPHDCKPSFEKDGDGTFASF